MRLLLASMCLFLFGFTPDDPTVVLHAMEIEPGDIIAGTVSTDSAVTGAPSDPRMFSAIPLLGPIQPIVGADMALLFTGNVELLPQLTDHDYVLLGSEDGDRATLRVRLQVPEDAQSYCFRFQFLSREYPEWVGNIYNDEFAVHVQNPAHSGQIVFDAFGNPVTINSALFAITNPALMEGTGFDDDGRTGWVTTSAPVAPGSELDISFEVFDVSDGIFDSAVLLDGFEWKTEPLDDPITDPGNQGPLRVAYLSPKEGPLEGGYPVNVFGVGFDNNTVLRVDGVTVPTTVQSSGTVLSVSGEDWPAADEPSTVDIEVQRGDQTRLLEGAFTYFDAALGAKAPHIKQVAPSELPPGGGRDVDITGESFVEGAAVVIVGYDGVEQASLEADWSNDGERLTVVSPPLDEGWYEVVVINPDGLRSTPGYPVLSTVRANGTPPLQTGCGCSTGGAGALPLLLLLGFRRRLRPGGPTPAP